MANGVANSPVFCGAAPPWTPAALLSGADGLWMDLDATGAVTRNTQPVPDDWDMETAGTARWVSIDGSSTLSKQGSARTGAQCLRLAYLSWVNPGARQSSLLNGNRYLGASTWGRTDGTVGSRTAFIVGASFVYGTPANTNWEQLVCGEFVSSGIFDLYGFGLAAGQYVEHDDFSVGANMSVKDLTCKGNLGNLTQATAASMAWQSDASAPTSVLLNGKHVLYFDGTADHMASTGAASTWPLHKAAGFTCCFAIKPPAGAAGTDTVIDTCNATNTNHGVTIEYDATNAQIVVKVANGSGTFVVNKGSGAGTVPANAWSRVTVTWSEAGGVSIRVDEDAADTDASVGAASANDATATLQVGRASGGANFLAGALAGLEVIVGAKSDADMVKWLNWAKGYYGL